MAVQSYAELTLQGSGEHAEALIEEICRGRGDECPVFFAGRERVLRRGFLEGLRERLHLQTRLLLPLDLGRALAAELRARPDIDLEVSRLQEIDRAELDFSYECYSREDAQRVREVVEAELPEGVRLEGYERDDQVDEEARGVELYSPVHDFVARGSGRYAGDVAGVVELADRLSGQDFIHPGQVDLVHRK